MCTRVFIFDRGRCIDDCGSVASLRRHCPNIVSGYDDYTPEETECLCGVAIEETAKANGWACKEFGMDFEFNKPCG